MKNFASLLALTATCAAAVPAASQTFTLTLSSNDTSLNNLGVVESGNKIGGIGYFQTIDSRKDSPTVFFLENGTEGRLQTHSLTDNSLRYAWIWDQTYVNSIQFDKEGGHDGTIYDIGFKITPDNLLVPAGRYSGFPWSFCSSSSDIVGDDNLGGSISLGEVTCIGLAGLNVVASE